MTCSSMVVIRLIAITICLSTCAQLGHSLLEELERDVTSNIASLVKLSSSQLSDEEGSTIKFKASSSWRNKYNSSKAVKGGRSYWCSKKTDPAPHWWISFVAKPIEVVSIAFEEKYPGAEFEFFASSGKECAEDGTVLIKGTQAEISNEKFENGRRYHCYGLKITKLVQTKKYGALASLRNFQLTINHKDDCNKHSCSGNGNCIGHHFQNECECHAGFKGRDCEEIDHCEGQNCSGNGKCINGLNEYSCDCFVGFEGADCKSRSGCPLSSSRHYKEYVDKLGYFCYKGFVVGCEKISSTKSACKSTYSKKMDTDAYFWGAQWWSDEKYHICSSHEECLKHMMKLDKKQAGDFLPCPPNRKAVTGKSNEYWNRFYNKKCRYGHFYYCTRGRDLKKSDGWICAASFKIPEHGEYMAYMRVQKPGLIWDPATKKLVKIQDEYNPTCSPRFPEMCDLLRFDRELIKTPVIEDDPERWG